MHVRDILISDNYNSPLATIRIPRLNGDSATMVWTHRKGVQSLDEGFHGRLGLHALPNPKTEAFCQKIGFARLGVDAAVENLPYYELSREAAARFLAGGKP